MTPLCPPHDPSKHGICSRCGVRLPWIDEGHPIPRLSRVEMSLLPALRTVFRGGLWRDSYFSRRGWVFSRRYYSPGGWRVPRLVFDQYWQYDASGRSMSIQLSHLHGIPQAVRRFRRLRASDAACAVCLKPEQPWRRMLWYPLDWSAVAGAYICSDSCWDRFDAIRDGEDDDA